VSTFALPSAGKTHGNYESSIFGSPKFDMNLPFEPSAITCSWIMLKEFARWLHRWLFRFRIGSVATKPRAG
jgi:hypothetical protein